MSVVDSVFTVSELSRYIKGKFDTDLLLNNLYVKGEVSNCKYHSSGHIYFTLKDRDAQIACVMFAGRRAGISFVLEDGQSVIVFGRASVYEAGGRYQVYADEIRLDGIGRLYEKYEELKRNLNAEGLFDVSHKKAIPKYAKSVGIVTARTGAAIQDICQISNRRNPYVRLLLYPAQVQGEGASDTIVKGIEYLDGKVDVIIVGRGGGSIEDLWAFNEEKTARAIFNCNTPIISAVGHETDTTIADYVSDLRAPTPSAAAELAVYDISLFEKTLSRAHEKITDSLLKRIDHEKSLIAAREMRLKKLSPVYTLKLRKEKLANTEVLLRKAIEKVVVSKKNEVENRAQKLSLLNPVKKLESGFSYIETIEGKNVSSVLSVNPGSEISAFVTDGKIIATVNSIEEITR